MPEANLFTHRTLQRLFARLMVNVPHFCCMRLLNVTSTSHRMHSAWQQYCRSSRRMRMACQSVMSGRRIACAWHASLFEDYSRSQGNEVASCTMLLQVPSGLRSKYTFLESQAKSCLCATALFCVCMMTRIGSHTVAVRSPSEADSFTVPFACRRL